MNDRDDAEASAELEALSRSLERVRGLIRQLEANEALLKARIHPLMDAVGREVVPLGERAMRRSAPLLRLKVTDLLQLPDAYKKHVADKKKIRDHFRETEESLPGCEVEEAPGQLTFGKGAGPEERSRH